MPHQLGRLHLQYLLLLRVQALLGRHRHQRRLQRQPVGHVGSRGEQKGAVRRVSQGLQACVNVAVRDGTGFTPNMK